MELMFILKTKEADRSELRIMGFVRAIECGTFSMTVLTVVTIERLSLHHFRLSQGPPCSTSTSSSRRAESMSGHVPAGVLRLKSTGNPVTVSRYFKSFWLENSKLLGAVTASWCRRARLEIFKVSSFAQPEPCCLRGTQGTRVCIPRYPGYGYPVPGTMVPGFRLEGKPETSHWQMRSCHSSFTEMKRQPMTLDPKSSYPSNLND
eukprot:3941465-Rhodomonas_salina.3